MRPRVFRWMTALTLLMLYLTACSGGGAPEATPGELPNKVLPAATAAIPPVAPSATVAPTATATPTASTATAAATRPGADYILELPREAAVPSGWIMNPAPDFEERRPEPGDTYRFACLDLPARSVGVASVGYRHLEGLPNVYIEYVVYPSAESATAALEDMLRASQQCTEFNIGEGDGATTAAFSPLDFPAHGEAGFAAELRTDSPVTGALLTHMVKVRSGHVVIGVSQSNYTGESPPDLALTESLVALAVDNLADGPPPLEP